MSERGRKKVVEGTVIRRSGLKTVVVELQRLVMDPIFQKYVRRRSRFHVHDPEDSSRVGDLVRIHESRPISRTKRWVLTQVVKRGVVTELPTEI
ncbi:MAG: 30S ribosomal protein S17 [Deltaproteobacteria bacterium]|nr:30S ribosomal protein S17 [Deltaproteobacteria bacterium]